MKTISIELTDYNIYEVNTQWWKQIMSLFLKPGRDFEIRHWREEDKIVKKGSAYGIASDADSTEFEVSIKGTLTSSAVNDILNIAASPSDRKMTEFFTIIVCGAVSSSHYGKQLYVFNPSEELCRQLYTILEPIKEYFTFGECGD